MIKGVNIGKQNKNNNNLVQFNTHIHKGSNSVSWGDIGGDIVEQTDLNNILNNKADLVGGKVPSSQLPSYVDDVLEFANFASLPTTGEHGKIYITIDNNNTYRWTGSTYIQIGGGASGVIEWGDIQNKPTEYNPEPHTHNISDIGTLQGTIDSLLDGLYGKADAVHSHTIEDVSGLQDILDSKLEENSVNNITNKTIDDYTNFIHADGIHLRVKATEPLVKGDVVKFVGFNTGEQVIEVAKRDNINIPAIGVVYANSMATGDFGMAVSNGLFKGINTSSFAEGTILYPNTSGGFTNIKPSGYAQQLAYVVRSHAVNGEIMINVGPVYNTDLSNYYTKPEVDTFILSFSGLTQNLFIQSTQPTVTVDSLWIDTTGGNYSFNIVTP